MVLKLIIFELNRSKVFMTNTDSEIVLGITVGEEMILEVVIVEWPCIIQAIWIESVQMVDSI